MQQNPSTHLLLPLCFSSCVIGPYPQSQHHPEPKLDETTSSNHEPKLLTPKYTEPFKTLQSSHKRPSKNVE